MNGETERHVVIQTHIADGFMMGAVSLGLLYESHDSFIYELLGCTCMISVTHVVHTESEMNWVLNRKRTQYTSHDTSTVS